ncbi:hypothetical protein [Pseudaminobacter soli (ex Li et al. 2025)]|nr:hypothetical protein [Mesorhizobium soli]
MSFLNGEISAGALWHEIEAEVMGCLAATFADAGVGHVIITDGPKALVTGQHADVLLRALAEGSLPLDAACYIADAMIMSDCFDFGDERVSEALSYLSDESVPFSRQEAEALRGRLSAPT